MLILFLFLSGVIGILFGSFATVLITRWHDGIGGIVSGRSECPQCRHKLSWYELIPLISYAIQRGRCRHCGSQISPFYPGAEILMGSIFVILSYAYISLTGRILDIGHLLLIVGGFITGVYILYDQRYMEIPDEIMVPGIVGLVCIFILFYFFPQYQYIYLDRGTYQTGIAYSDMYIFDHILGGIVLYSFFYLQILIPGVWQLSKQRKYREAFGLLVSYVTFPLLLMGSLFRREKAPGDTEEELMTWVGGGDLRVALFIGLSLGTIHGIAAVFFGYILGTIISLILMISKKTIIRTIAFGPFLGLGWVGAIFYYDAILQFIGI